jgi:thiamine biosynthesis lipoprotein
MLSRCVTDAFISLVEGNRVREMIRHVLLCFALLPAVIPQSVGGQEGVQIMEFGGATMGTSYSVKIFDPPEFHDDVRLTIDAELRRVNDQMSTYLKSSELSRFNASSSTEWFDVSDQTAMVVSYAQEVAAKTGGAFDVTVGQLVNAWSFGPEPRSQSIPSSERLAEIRQSVGFDKLAVRLDPPALRKSVPGLEVDLSALAKGHGVDRVVELLDSMGAANVFVEIGGEIRTSGDKNGEWWRVGIQLPDSVRDSVMIAHPMSTDSGTDEAMATSGDYRNFFVVDGRRYSHTIDPRTGRPVDHDLASVSVIAPSCMAADAWATAINVVGRERGLELAENQNLDVLVVSRDGQRLSLSGTGVLAKYAPPVGNAAEQAGPGGNGNTWFVMLLTFVAFGMLLFAMAVGVIFGRRAISGSCGGLSNSRNEDGSISCGLCSNPADACKELRERMRSEAG